MRVVAPGATLYDAYPVLEFEAQVAGDLFHTVWPGSTLSALNVNRKRGYKFLTVSLFAVTTWERKSSFGLTMNDSYDPGITVFTIAVETLAVRNCIGSRAVAHPTVHATNV